MKIGLKKRICNRLIYYSYILPSVHFNKNKNKINPRNTILIFSNPRGGSTWLAEILHSIPNSTLAIEPLMRGKLKEFEKLNFFWHQPIPEDADWDEAKTAFRKLINREIIPLSIYYRNELLKIPSSEYFIFKFCHGNMMLPWVVKNFNVNPLLIIRHPCAVVNSQIKHGSWNHMKNNKINYRIPDFRYNEYYLRYSEVLQKVKTIEENLAATWALTMVYSVLNKNNDKKWITVAYESLYENSEIEIERIFSRLELTIPEDISKRISDPSFTTKEESINKIEEKRQLENWRKELTSIQQKRILNIIKEFDIDFYDNSLEPDYNKIYSGNKALII